MAEFEAAQIVVIAVTGLAAGVLGGMLGVGGSLIMIPALVLMYGQSAAHPGVFGSREHFNQHLYQAAAMAVNVAVAVPATWRHAQAKAIVGPVLRWMMPAAVAMVLVGVAVSNLTVFRAGMGPIWLGRLLAIFLVYVIAVNIRRIMVRPVASPVPLADGSTKGEADSDRARVWPAASASVGSAMGFVAGLLGIGGGAIAVPMQQIALRLPLRQCIANSAAVMCVSAAIGAAYKIATLPGESVGDALVIAAMLAPTALVGGWIGGRLTHAVPLPWVRGIWIAVLVASAWKMAAIPL